MWADFLKHVLWVVLWYNFCIHISLMYKGTCYVFMRCNGECTNPWFNIYELCFYVGHYKLCFGSRKFCLIICIWIGDYFGSYWPQQLTWTLIWLWCSFGCLVYMVVNRFHKKFFSNHKERDPFFTIWLRKNIMLIGICNARILC